MIWRYRSQEGWKERFHKEWNKVKGFCNALEDLEGKEFIENFISAELSKARKEGYLEGLKAKIELLGDQILKD